MYGKIFHGASFGGLINYINDPRKMRYWLFQATESILRITKP